MNGFNNKNLMMAFFLAKDMPARERFFMAMSAGQSKNLLGPVLLKIGAIDPITNLTQENTDLNTANKNLKAQLAACKDGTELKDLKAALTKCQAELKTCQAELAQATANR